MLSSPPPFVFFEAFGDSSLNFILFVYLANVTRSFAVRTDLRIAILKAFRKNGIEIPYPQTDIHLRDVDFLKSLVAERRRKPTDDRPVSHVDFEAESQDPAHGEGDSNGD